MKRFGGWLGKGHSAVDDVVDFNELEALQDAMRGTVLVMNDEYEEAAAALSAKNTPFHKLGLGCVCFLKAIMGMQKPDIEKGLKILAEAEQLNADFHKRAQSDPNFANKSAIYPPGTEYALAHAESQLMFAVCAIMNASVMESLRALYKVRKAYATLQDIADCEQRYLKNNGHLASSVKAASVRPASRASSAVAPSVISSRPGAEKTNGHLAAPLDEDDDDDDFHDAEEDLSESPVSPRYQGKLTSWSMLDLHSKYKADANGSTPPVPAIPRAASVASTVDDFDFRSVTSDPIDHFIHAGVGLAFGTIQLVLSLVPPPFDKALAIFSFRGDRKTGLNLLWDSTKFITDINGALAGLITLVFHNGPIAFSDIIPKSALPKERLELLLHELRKLYPRSQIWQIEEAIMLSEARQLDSALNVLTTMSQSPLQSIRSLGQFEVALHHLYAHDYKSCAAAFIALLDLGDWSHGLYYYVAAISYVELYREAKVSNPTTAQAHATQAQAYFDKVIVNLGRKKVMGRELPIEGFVKRKMTKYSSRAAAQKTSFVDAIGVSPAEDIIYFWGGYDCMPDKDLRVSIEKLAWSERQPGWDAETADEKCLFSLFKATCLRVMGQVEKAKAELQSGALSHTQHSVKAVGKQADEWALAVSHYELAVCYWQEAGGETGDRALLQQAAQEIRKLKNWGEYDLESSHGLKTSTAAETLKNLGIHV